MSTKYLFAASTGGHLAQLARLSEQLDSADDSLWITFRSPQSESLLKGRRVIYLPYIRPRDFAGVLRGMGRVRRLLAEERFDRAISTGAAIALAVFPITRAKGIANEYIESVSRVEGPSLTGRILASTRLASTWTQHEGWASKRWKLRPSVLAGFRAIPNPREVSPDRPIRIFTTLGTIEGYRFDALVDHVQSIAPSAELTWQLGFTERTDLPGRASVLMSNSEFEDAATSADVVITHSGVGTILKLLDLGIFPIVVPRRARRGEHVDDHQEQIAALVQREGLACVREVENLTVDDLASTRALAVEPTTRHDAETH